MFLNFQKMLLHACFVLNCFMHIFQPDRPKLDLVPKGNINIGMTLQSAKNLAKLGKNMLASATVSKVPTPLPTLPLPYSIYSQFQINFYMEQNHT